MSDDRPVIRSEESVPVQRWDDDVRGHMSFRTLFGEGGEGGEGGDPTGSICAGLGYLEPDEWLGSHHHSATEIYFVIDGNGSMTLDGAQHDVRAGQAIYIPGNTEHSIRNTGSTPLRFFYTFDVGTFTHVRYRFPTGD